MKRSTWAAAVLGVGLSCGLAVAVAQAAAPTRPHAPTPVGGTHAIALVDATVVAD